jgi:hypothetical protein
MKFYISFITIVGIIFCDTAIASEPISTELVVRAKARDGKFIGSSIGGALVRIKDTENGEILAEGMIQGGTGDTNLIMTKPKKRYDSITKGTAFFKTELLINKPVLLTIELISPYIKRQARTVSQIQTWLIPGKHINGDGLIIEVPGMIVDILSPQTHRYTGIENSPFELKANVVMMCGCIITKNGLWDAHTIEVTAMITKDGDDYATVPLEPADTMNTFSSHFNPNSSGVYGVTIYAYDPKTGNTGVDQTSFIVTD